jgi:hypothetical protein
MADYFPLIARAVAGLDKNTGENRRALYERARTALVNQLRGVEPALAESDITRERLALEESIRKVEAEAAKRARGDSGESEEARPSLRDHGLRDFRDSVAEAQGLGDATAQANRTARATYDAVPSEVPNFGESDRARSEPYMSEPYFQPPAAEPTRPEHSAPQDIQPAQEQFHEQAHDQAREQAYQPVHESAEPEADPRSVPPEMTWRAPPQHRYDEQDEEAYARPARPWGRIIKAVVLLLVLGGIAAGLYTQRHMISSMMANFRSATPPAKPAETAQPAGRPKIADRIGGDSRSDSATAPAAAVAQKVVLYDEDPNDPAGKRYVGSALWRTETVSPGPGLAPELAIRADVEIPERGLRMTWSLRRNTDKALPASHTIEIMFTLGADFPEGGIGNVPGVLMKQNEQARGSPLAGLAVKVTNGYFLIGLSAVDVDVQRNIQLLKERDWFDIPVVYTSGKRAILAIEKGTPGSRAFAEAFRAWGD